jgi:multiple sugar transport system substrate-binding protein
VPALTKRELAAAELIRSGLSDKEIARRLNINLANTKSHVHNLLGKLNVRRRSQVADHFHIDEPQIQEAVIRTLDKLSTMYKNGYIPPSSINWNDADDNNAFHSKLCVMDFDGTLSTELAMLRKQKNEYNDVITMPPLHNDEKQMVTQIGGAATMIPKGAANIATAKEFQKYLIQPEVNREFLTGRFMSAMPELVKDDSWWTDSERDPHVPPYVKQGLFSPTKPDYFAYNPAWAQVRAEHPFHVAFHDIVAANVPVKEAAAKALKRVQDIFAKYPIQET